MEQGKYPAGYLEHLIADERLLPSHISMYVSLFQCWKLNRFQNPFRIRRAELMRSSKIKSLATYHKCIKELDQAGFIIYLPSYNSYKGTLIEITNMEFRNIGKCETNPKLFSRTESRFSIPVLYEIELYFRERDIPCTEAAKFYSFYQSKNWTLQNNKPMVSWEAAARNWITDLKRTLGHREIEVSYAQ